MSKNGAIRTVCRGTSGFNHELTKPDFLVTTWNTPRLAAKGESLNAMEREHKLVLHSCFKMSSSDVCTPLVKLCFALRGSLDTALYYFSLVYRYLLIAPNHPTCLTALHHTTYTPIYLPTPLLKRHHRQIKPK